MESTRYFGGVEGRYLRDYFWRTKNVGGWVANLFGRSLRIIMMELHLQVDTKFNILWLCDLDGDNVCPPIDLSSGGTHSNLVICDHLGKVVGRSRGPGTNHWALGIDECARRVIDMLHAAKEDAGIPLDTPLDSLGLTLSGCEQESSNALLADSVRAKDPACARAIYVASDTAGSLFTGAPNGGMVLIAGTGSNSLLRTRDGQQYGCGGWGYLFGDEGGAYWIAFRAVKTIFDDVDGLRPSPHPTERVWRAIKEHFNAETRADLLPYASKLFDKSQFAGLTAKLSKLAESGDALSQHLFADAGAALAAHVAALIQRAQDAHKAPVVFRGGIRVVCVGSVWNSWKALKPGALKQLADRRVNFDLELVRLRVSSAMGAAWLAAKHVDYDLPRDDTAFCDVFYTYRPDSTSKLNGNHNGISENGTGENGNSENNTSENGNIENGTIENGVQGCGCSDWSLWS